MTQLKKIVYADIKNVSFVKLCECSTQPLKFLNCSLEDIAKEIEKGNIHMHLIPRTEHPYIPEAVNKKILTSSISYMEYDSVYDFWDVVTISGTWYRLF